jgi:hypothetical protein
MPSVNSTEPIGTLGGRKLVAVALAGYSRLIGADGHAGAGKGDPPQSD